MRGTIAWSYGLLDAAGRSFLRTLSAFDGGWDIMAAGAVADLGENEALSAISALVDASLASLVATDGDVARYRMLDVVGEFAAERAADEGETDTFARRHAEYFLALAEAAEPNLGAATQGAWHRRLESDLGNLRAAMRWARDGDQADVALRLAGALWQFWRLYGGFTEGRRWLEAAIAMEGAEKTDDLPKALWGAAWLAYHQDDFTRAGSLGDRLVSVSRERRLPLDVRNGLTVLGMVAVADGRFPEALELFRQSVEISTTVGSSWHLATSLFNLGQAALLADDRGEAERLWNDALSRYRQLGDEHFAARLEGHLGYLPLLAGDLEAAGTRFAASLEVFSGLGDEWGVAEALERCAVLAASRSKDRDAATIAGAAEVLRERLAARPMPFDRVLLEPYLVGARARVGEDLWRERSEEGRRMTLESAIDLALVDAGPRAPA
jgi:tetratricopeptide (TPR) repeat protein